MAGVKRISREEIDKISEDDDPWKIIMRPEKRRKVAADEAQEPYIYAQTLDEFDSRLSFNYSVTLYDQLVDWRKKGKGPEAFRTYSKFQIEDTDLEVGDIVFVNFGDPEDTPTPDEDMNEADGVKESEVAREEGASEDSKSANGNSAGEMTSEVQIERRQEPLENWVAKVLECRAFDQEHVFLRVLWLYRPEDLPGGRRPWHGWNEVFPSNAMQIIDAMTVSGKAGPLIKWNEADGQKTQDYDGLIWRQTAKVRTKPKKTDIEILGRLKTYCICKEPANPEGDLVKCKACGESMHDTCIEKAAVEKAVADEKKKQDTTHYAEVDKLTAGTGEESEKLVINRNTFNPISGAFHIVVDSLKRASTPNKASKAKEETDSSKDLANVATNDMLSLSNRSFTARLAGLDGEDKDVPLRVEILEHFGDDDGRPIALEKVHCLFCGNDIE